MRSVCGAVARRFISPVGVIPLLALVAVGCGRGDVSGTISYKGKALVWGTIQLEAADKTLKQTNLNSDGRYLLEGVPVGEARIAVSSTNPQSSDFQPLHAGPAFKPKTPIKGWFPIPGAYFDITKSPLTYTVKRGLNTYDIELK
jgi:hypothetical protein